MTTPSIIIFFKKDANKTPLSLPESSSPVISSANKQIENEFQDCSSKKEIKRKRGTYGDYSPETRSKMAKYAIENGNTAAAKYFSQKLQKSVNESTIRSIKSSYNRVRRLQKSIDCVALPKSPRGKPLKVGKFDPEICDYVRNLRKSGTVVNTRIVLAGAKGIIMARERTMLSSFGGPIELTKAWAASLLNRLGMVKRKGTKGVKHLPKDFAEIKSEFLERINKIVKKHNIPPSLIVNWDQTGCNFVPTGEWTMEVEGAKQVPIAHMDDKRQMTVLLACSLSGKMLPPQLIYQGKSDACHPNYKFPNDWHITHTECHWSTSESMKLYVEHVIVPYINEVRDKEDLPLKSAALCIFDIYKAHRGEELLNLLKQNNIQVVFIPASCTDQLQPLDLNVNGSFKKVMKTCFEDWYAEQVTKQLKKRVSIESVAVDMKLSVIKPIHARCLVKSVDDISVQSVKKAWDMAGITESAHYE